MGVPVWWRHNFELKDDPESENSCSEKIHGARGKLAPEMLKRAPESHKRAPKVLKVFFSLSSRLFGKLELMKTWPNDPTA